jgi:hypothetical protein
MKRTCLGIMLLIIFMVAGCDHSVTTSHTESTTTLESLSSSGTHDETALPLVLRFSRSACWDRRLRNAKFG